MDWVIWTIWEKWYKVAIDIHIKSIISSDEYFVYEANEIPLIPTYFLNELYEYVMLYI